MDLHVDVLPAAERPPYAAERHPHLVLGKTERRRDLASVDVKPLRRDDQFDPAVFRGDGQTRLRTERGLILHPGLVVPLHPHLGLGVGIAVLDAEVPEHVSPVVKLRRGRIERVLHVEHRLEHLVPHAHLVGGSFGELERLGGDDGDGLSHVEHAIVGEHRLVGELESVRLLPSNVVVRQHGVNAGARDRVGEVDGLDARVRVGTSNGRTPQHPVVPQIAAVREGAGHLGDAVDPAKALADGSTGAFERSAAHALLATRWATRRPSRAISSSSAEARRPSRTTNRPSTSR